MKQIIVDTRTGRIERILPSYIKVVEIDTVPIEPVPKENTIHELRYSDEKGLHYIEIPVVKEVSTEDKIHMLEDRLNYLEKNNIGSVELPKTLGSDVAIDIRDTIKENNTVEENKDGGGDTHNKESDKHTSPEPPHSNQPVPPAPNLPGGITPEELMKDLVSGGSAGGSNPEIPPLPNTDGLPTDLGDIL